MEEPIESLITTRLIPGLVTIQLIAQKIKHDEANHYERACYCDDITNQVNKLLKAFVKADRN
jgi:hypothetical protein